MLITTGSLSPIFRSGFVFVAIAMLVPGFYTEMQLSQVTGTVRVKRLLIRSLRVKCIVFASICIVLTGCSQDDASQAGSDYVRPGWMAEVKQAKEIYNHQLADCYTNRGFEVSYSVEGDPSIRNEVSENGDIPPQVLELTREVLADCAEQYPPPAVLRLNDAGREYDRMLEVRECLIHEGYDISEPPSKDVWVDAANNPTADNVNNLFSPYSGLGTTDPNISWSIDVSSDELARLNEVCPQPLAASVSTFTRN